MQTYRDTNLSFDNISTKNIRLLLSIWKKFFIIFTILIIGIAIYVYSFFGILIALVFVFLSYTIPYILKEILANREFMRLYAESNNFEYHQTQEYGFTDKKMFDHNRFHRVSNVIKGSYLNNNLRMFNYGYCTQGGSSNIQVSSKKKMYKFTVCEVTIEHTHFPHILLQHHSLGTYDEKNKFNNERTISINIEDQAAGAFKLYCTEDYEIEALQIFTEEILQWLRTYNMRCNIEFYGNNIYFYDNTVIRTKEELDQLHSLVQRFLDKKAPLLHRLYDDFEAMHQHYQT